MSRIRSIKPEIATSEQFVSCSRDARLLFILIWNHCDDAGVHPDSTRRVKMELFPGDDDATCEKVSAWIDELINVRLLGRFGERGATYLYVTGWQKHQSIQRPYFKFPKPPGWTGKHNTRRARDDNEHSTCSAQAPPDTEKDTEKDTDTELNTGKRVRASQDDPDPPLGPTCHPEMIPLPDNLDVPAFRETWARWVSYLREKENGRLSQQTLEAMLVKLARWGPDGACQSIRHSIESSWKFLKPPSEINDAKGSKSGSRHNSGSPAGSAAAGPGGRGRL